MLKAALSIKEYKKCKLEGQKCQTLVLQGKRYCGSTLHKLPEKTKWISHVHIYHKWPNIQQQLTIHTTY